MNNLAALAGRILVALIFLDSGIRKFVDYSGALGYGWFVGRNLTDPNGGGRAGDDRPAGL